jgi:3-oxoadipate enol-lactonase
LEVGVFVKVGEQLVHTVRSGSGARTVVGIPGSFGTTEIWEQPFEVLSSRHRTIAFDHFGTGETHVPDELVTFESQVGLVVGLLDELGVSACVLAGDSSMAAVAVEVARRHPDRVEALILVAAGISYAPDEGVHRFVSGLRTNPESTLEGFARLCLPEDDRGHLRRWLKDIIMRTGPSRAARMVESFYEVDIRDRLPELSVPTTVVHGEFDALPSSRLDTARELASLIPGAQLQVINGIGHVPTLSRPTEVADAIEEKLRQSG